MKRPPGPSRRASRLVELRHAGLVWSSWYMPCCGLGVFVLRCPDGTQGKDVSSRRCWRCCPVKRPAAAGAPDMPSLALTQESVVLSMFPRLSDLLLNPNWDDASQKGKRCVMLFIDDSATRLLVKMEGDGLKFSTVAHGVDEALAVAEKLLVSGQVVWEQDVPTSARQGRKKK